MATPTDESLLESYDLGQYENKYVVPDNWFFDVNGSLVPFEFRATNEPDPVLPSEDFAADLYKALKDAGLERVLGVRSLENLKGADGSWEITPEGSKINVTSYKGNPDEMTTDDMINVGFQYNKNGDRKEKSSSCGSHQIQCRTCNSTCTIWCTKRETKEIVKWHDNSL